MKWLSATFSFDFYVFNTSPNCFKEWYLGQNLLYLSKKRPKLDFNSVLIPIFDLTAMIWKGVTKLGKF